MTNEIVRGLIDLAKWIVMAFAIIFTTLTVRSCARLGEKTPAALPEQLTIHDTIPGDPKLQLVHDIAPGKPVIIYVPVPAGIDKDSVSREHFAKAFYSDTIRKEGSALIIINDFLSKNKI